MINVDVVIIGAGGSGLMCGATAGNLGRNVVIIDHAKKIGEKIRISGGGKCNFTNIYASPENYISQNPHFIKSALTQYSQWDFIKMVEKNNIEYYEKTLGQLFCKNSSQQIIDMLVKNCQDNSVKINMQTNIISVEKTSNGFIVNTDKGQYSCKSLVISCGGLSIPKIGATGLGYKIAKQFDIPVIPTSPALVPLTFNPEFLSAYKQLSGVSLNATVSTHNISFKEGLLFTHRGLSGPSILQISSYLKSGTHININLCPTINIEEFLLSEKQKGNNKKISSIIKNHMPQKLTEVIIKNLEFNSKLTETSNKDINLVATHINNWKVTPTDSEGYRTAEVTLGGVDTNYLSSKTMETKTIKGLYFIGEVVDVTGWLGGYNFQWAWSSGFVAGLNT
ncbi:MAG: NAD(P)/FAD-dependent oxidoreductase [Alphaproteobacteria bacterium]|nr:NAD(P)/FAD-dependent oxidoreductase [Alphaproteobacteria bacterium]